MFTHLITSATDTPARLSGTIHAFVCSDCGEVIYCTPIAYFTPGYGSDRTGALHCYACITNAERQGLKTSRVFFGYLSSDARSVTNWPGAQLMRVTSHNYAPRAGWGGLAFVRAVDADGQEWHGKGSEAGMCITMRKCKG